MSNRIEKRRDELLGKEFETLCGRCFIIDYKGAKECHIKSLAEKWKGKIDDKVYQALLEWKIEITD